MRDDKYNKMWPVIWIISICQVNIWDCRHKGGEKLTFMGW